MTIADIAARLEVAKKLSRTERENLETVLSNRYGCGEVNDDQYRTLIRALAGHA